MKTQWRDAIVDALGLVCVTVLGVTRALGPEVVASLIMWIAGARVVARQRSSGGGSGDSKPGRRINGGIALLVVGLAGMLASPIRRVTAAVSAVLVAGVAYPAIAFAEVAEPVVVDVVQVVALVSARAWIPLAAILIGLLVRLLKTKRGQQWVGHVPPRYRPLVALGLGLVSSVLEAMVAGQEWVPALVGGVLSAAIAALGHDVLIEGLRGGRELGAPMEES